MSRRVELDIAKYLEANIDWITRQSTASAKNITPTLFIGDLPLPVNVSSPTGVPVRAMSISEYPGESPQYFLGGGNRRIEKPRILVTHRHTRYDLAQTDAYQVHDFLNWKRGITIDGVPHVLIKAVALPSEATPDGQDNAIFTTNFMIWRQFDA